MWSLKKTPKSHTPGECSLWTVVDMVSSLTSTVPSSMSQHFIMQHFQWQCNSLLIWVAVINSDHRGITLVWHSNWTILSTHTVKEVYTRRLSALTRRAEDGWQATSFWAVSTQTSRIWSTRRSSSCSSSLRTSDFSALNHTVHHNTLVLDNDDGGKMCNIPPWVPLWDGQRSSHTFLLLSKRPSTVFLPVWPQCVNARRNRCQEDLNSFPLGELEETTRTHSYYVNKEYLIGPEIQ